MNIIAWILLGLIAGAIARMILPGKQGGGWIGALLTGLIGALLGGWIASLMGLSANEGFFDLTTWIFAILGGVIVGFVWQAITRSRSKA
ncbi:GlsB/YeaQ/YmgE family stress response membrane protein [Citricoccus sp. NR2]|uniref:GlsB/YeaQ/YmgE family stress response membrane protein n=1 Tax=Citricoccus sp. NR2 TaxID=3004095 RepID=UPI0022DE6251|nr:GlsB/YeaQ/YmgE family stress response membrane protein [Citricoccus sp. NR2]WBL17994.1 GlsB/YeaQ/YmgE family stress response membrane protein [Citricoccus sp. NR2]